MNSFPWPILLVLLLVPVLIAWGVYRASQRRKELGQWAARRGWRFSRERDRSLDDRYPEFDCLRRGSNRFGYNFVIGQSERRRVACFDYRYTTQSGSGKHRSSTNHTFSAVIVRATVPLKPLTIRREHLFDKLGSFFGFDDIDFESAEFSRRFCVKSPDRKWAYDVLHARAIEFLLGAEQFNLEFDAQGHVIAWRADTWKPDEFEQAIGVVEGILDRLPDYVREQQGAVPA